MRCVVSIPRRSGCPTRWSRFGFVVALSAILHFAPPALSQTPPEIISQPRSSTNLTATDVTFTVVATGTAPLRYQWYFNTTNRMTGETSSSLLLTNLGAFQEAAYTVVITNVAGAVTSAPAILTIWAPPAITRQPTNQIVAVGGTAIFTMAAAGTEPITYQWFYNVIDEIVGATDTTLVLTNVQPTDSGTYQAEASNVADTVHTVEAVLLVKHPVTITSQPTSLVIAPGEAAAFSVEVSGDGPIRYQWFFNETNTIFAATNATLSISSSTLQNSGTYSVRVINDVANVTSSPATLVVLQAPIIGQQPANTVALAGASASFSVGATGTAPLSYQWFFNGTNVLPDATGAMLTITNLTAQNAGLYSVVVSNQVGSLRSGNASLTVIVPPVITVQPAPVAVPPGQKAAFSVQATGSAPLIYRWYFNGTNLILGANSPALTIGSAQFANAGTYSVTITNLAGGVTSSPVQLVVQSPPVISQQPVNRSTLPGGDASFSVTVQGEAPLGYQWFFNATNSIADATNTVLMLTNVQPAGVGRYSLRITNRLGSVLSSEAILTIKQPPAITEQPVSLTVTQGGLAAFTVTHSGDGPFGYRWQFNGTNAEPGANGPTLVRTNATSTHAGSYSVVVTNEVGSATSAEAVLNVRLFPSITQQPANLILPAGGTATFGVNVIGESPFTYQWRYNTTNDLPAATNSTLVLTNIQLNQIGLYSVVIRNPVGSATSAGAMLSIQVPPGISLQPASLVVTQGQAGSFSVVAQGDGPFAYQWFFNLTNAIIGDTAATLSLTNIQPEAEGEYAVRVTNLVGSVFSAPAILSVRPLPSIAQQPVSLVVTQGQAATFSIIAQSDTPLTYQWRHNGLDLSAVAPSVVINGVQIADSGDYDVIVGNDYGAVTSLVATLTVFEIDFGDAPQPNYATLLADDAARHVIVPGVWLGFAVDAELDGLPDPMATGDDNTNLSDEDGIQFLTDLRIGQIATIEVIAGTNGLLSAWMDFNQTNGWLDGGEQVLTNHVLSMGTNLITLQIPRGAIVGETFARFRFSTAPGLLVTGLAPDGEVEDYRVNLQSAADLDLVQFASIPNLSAGSNAIFTVSVTNQGPSTASNVIVATRLSARSTFHSSTPSLGSCVFSNGVLTCGIGTITPGEGFTIAIEVAVGQGTNTMFSAVSAAQFDPIVANSSASLSIIGTSITPQFANSDIIILPVPDAGAGAPYPANIIVTGITGAVNKVLVTLRNVNHGFPDDLDILLVGPDGRHSMLMSDAGFDVPLVDATLSFDVDATAPLPDGGVFIPSGSYQPTDHPPSADSFPGPAPSGPYAANLAVFRGMDPNGVWSLHVVDDSADNGLSADPGFIADGWTLTFISDEPLADLAIVVASQPPVVSAGEALTHVITVTNTGPAASAATVRSVLPPELSFISATISQGGCSNAAGAVFCDLGVLPAGGSATFTLQVAAAVGGTFTNVVSVSGNQLDLNGVNNSAAAVSVVSPAANLGVALSGPQSPILLLEPFATVVVVTNGGPNLATGVWLTNQLPVGAAFVSANPTQGACANLGGAVVCPVGDVPAGSAVSIQLRMAAGALGVNSNFVRVAAVEQDLAPSNNSSAHLFTVNPAVDLVATSISSPATPAAGEEYELSVTVSNRGPAAVDALFVSRLPATAAFVSVSSTFGACAYLDGEVNCQMPGFQAGQSAVVSIRSRTTVVGTLTNVALVSGSIPDYDPGNNATTNIATVIASADLVLGLDSSPGPVWLGDNLNFTITVTNLGLNPAAAVQVTNFIPAGVSFISSAPAQGACAQVGAQVRCDVGSLAPGAGTVISVVTRPTQIGLATGSAVVGSAAFDPVAANNAAVRISRVITGSAVFANSARITTPILGLANPFPSSINVSGVPGTVFSMRVSLANFFHSYPDDLDVLLVGPGGRKVLLMSDAGGEVPMNGVTLTFDDAAPNALADLSGISSGVFRPTNYGAEADVFPAPAPLGPYGTNLSVFYDTNPNGVWSLYITDDADKDFGLLADGWSLAISTISPPVLSTIANIGIDEDTTTGAIPFTLQDFDTPVDTIVLTRSSSNPALVPVSGIILAGAGLNRSVSITPEPNLSGTSLITIIATDITGASATNQFTVIVRPVVDGIQMLVQPQSLLVLIGATVNFSVSASSALPLTYQWQRNGVDMPGATASSLVLPGVQFVDAGDYRVLLSNADTSIFSAVAVLQVTDEFPSPNIVSISRNGTTATVAFTTSVGATYTLEFKDTFDAVDWSLLGSIPGTGNTEAIIDPAAEVPARYYRVRVN